MYTFPNLFNRIKQVYEDRAQAQLTSEQLRLVERIHLDFVRAGAKFDSDAQAKYAKITEELAELTTKFMQVYSILRLLTNANYFGFTAAIISQNVLADESDIYLTLESDEDKVGLAADILAASRQAAIERNVPGENSCVITLSRSLVVPFLTFSERRYVFRRL